jgi:hypothetical protein
MDGIAPEFAIAPKVNDVLKIRGGDAEIEAADRIYTNSLLTRRHALCAIEQQGIDNIITTSTVCTADCSLKGKGKDSLLVVRLICDKAASITIWGDGFTPISILQSAPISYTSPSSNLLTCPYFSILLFSFPSSFGGNSFRYKLAEAAAVSVAIIRAILVLQLINYPFKLSS